MSLNNIISISGKSGLFRMLNKERTPIVVEDLENGRKRQLFPRDRVMALSEISMYTETGERFLSDIFTDIAEKYNKEQLETKDLFSSKDKLQTFFQELLPDYDKEKVYPTDIKRLVRWYNILVGAGITEFTTETKTTADENQEKE